MSDHKFKIGQVVTYRPRSGPGACVYQIAQLVPPVRDEPQYRIKSEVEPHLSSARELRAQSRSSYGWRRVEPAGRSEPFYGYNRPGAKVSQPIIWNWWRQGMMGGAKAHYDGIVAFSQTDFTEDLKKISIPVLVMHGDDDQIVPYADSGPLSAKLVKHGTLKTYKGFPHGMPTTEAPPSTRTC
jgi:non-heme chloroperoxidase